MDQYPFAEAGVGVGVDPGGGDRLPQWSIQETREFLVIRAELDPAFMETKRNKLLWELISTRIKGKGYVRSPDQCKCKWKNLVTRYKGCETREADWMRQQFPFYNEMKAIFNARMQKMLWMEAESGGATSSSRKKAAAVPFSSSSEEDENVDDGGLGKKKRKMKTKMKNPRCGSSDIVDGVKEMMDEFMKQQMEIEMQWIKAYEEREEKKRVKEMEWRLKMEALENERIMMNRRWREMEEQRRVREEVRAEKREGLITTLLEKLRRQGM